MLGCGPSIYTVNGDTDSCEYEQREYEIILNMSYNQEERGKLGLASYFAVTVDTTGVT